MNYELPQDFIALMHEHYDAETADRLCTALTETEPEVSIRINTRKYPMELPYEPVPWGNAAYYLPERPPFTFDPLLHAGAYYVQEASSMYVGHLIKQHLSPLAPLSALDLCAAPGGKSTLLAGLLPEGSLLISNEPMPKRAQILSENMQKWTRMAEGEYPVRCVVTNNYPEDFYAFTDSFDLLVTDVPCSGEGMFRKDEQAIRDWSLENVDICWKRQRSILQSIWHTLKPGGLLIYSTCTFNRLEDEDNARWICQEMGAELLEERHFLPGRDRGEGFYCAAIRKKTLPSPLSETEKEFEVEKKLASVIGKVGTLRTMPTAFQVEEGIPHIELTYDEALQYLRHEAVRVEAPRGSVLLCYKGLVLGPGKCVGNRINNLYPPEWRIRTTYQNRFSVEPLP